jgi:hypothetical protein
MDYTGKNLDEIKQKIEKMANTNQLKFLQFFVDNNITVNQNKSGIRINLGYVYQNNRTIFDEMIALMNTLEKEELLFNTVETEKKLLSESLKEE